MPMRRLWHPALLISHFEILFYNCAILMRGPNFWVGEGGRGWYGTLVVWHKPWYCTCHHSILVVGIVLLCCLFLFLLQTSHGWVDICNAVIPLVSIYHPLPIHIRSKFIIKVIKVITVIKVIKVITLIKVIKVDPDRPLALLYSLLFSTPPWYIAFHLILEIML